MDRKQAREMIQDIFSNAFDRERYIAFLRNLLNKVEPRDGHYTGNLVPEAYRDHINQYWRIGKYTDPDGEEIDLLVVEVKTLTKLERARSALRNFAINRLKKFGKESSLIAFYAKDDGGADWRFSFVKIEHEAFKDEKGKVKLKQELTPAKRYSYLVGAHENSHTACKQLLPILEMDYADPRISEIEAAFSIEKVTDEFFEQYKALFQKLAEHLKQQPWFQRKGTDDPDHLVSRFAKKLLGQIVFLYFLQKKGWLGAEKDAAWGTGPKNFMRQRFTATAAKGGNYYTNCLQYLFYEALADERKGQKDSGYYKRFDCRLPFLNGGLFEADYDWRNETITIPDSLFHNTEKTKAGDPGTGILDVFDRYNFTIKEDEPLDKEVAVDPEMLGKVFENMLEVTERKSKGAFYTPREIVHYMCQESLIHYLEKEVGSETEATIPKADLEWLIRKGHLALENDQRVLDAGRETATYTFESPEPIRRHATTLDAKLADIRVCDPAIGSGAFPVGILQEIVHAREVVAVLQQQPTRPYDLKKHAIANSIYGVDIDPSAIDIARLRLWLSLIVDEDDYASIDTLPNLDYKIMQGNSLIEEYEGVKLFDEAFIGEDEDTSLADEKKTLNERLTTIQREYVQGLKTESLSTARKAELDNEIAATNAQLKKIELAEKKARTQKNAHSKGLFDLVSEARKKAKLLESRQNEFFEVSSAEKKRALRDEITRLEWELIEATLQEQGKTDALARLAIFKTSGEKPYFLWKLNFSEVFRQKGGFDIVIGNPPYGVSIKGEMRESAIKVLGKVPDFEVYYFFIELSKLLLSMNSVNSYIIPNTILFNVYAEQYRKNFINCWGIHEILDCSSFKLFENAVVRNMIYIATTGHMLDKVCYRNTDRVVSFINLIGRDRQYISKDKLLSLNQNWGLAFRLPNEIIEIIEKISRQKQIISDYFDVSQGYIPYRRSDLVKKYGISRGNAIIDNREWHSDTKLADDYLQEIQGRGLSKFSYTKKNSFVKYGKHLAGYVDLKYFNQKRVLVREITNPQIIACTLEECLVNDPQIISIIPEKNISDGLDLVWAVLNSSLATFYHFNASPKATKGDFPKILIKDINDFPISLGNEAVRSCVSRIKQYCIKSIEDGMTLTSSFFNQLIDGLVYELYFPDEIKAAGKEILPHLGELTPIDDTMSDEEKLAIIQREFDRLYDPRHPVRNNLETLDSVPVVRTIREALKR